MSRSKPRGNVAPILIPVVATLMLVTGLAAYWFGFRDQDDKDAATATSTNQTFAGAAVPFTFEYPGDFAGVKAPEGFIWISGISPVDIIDIKRIAKSETGIQTLRQRIDKSLNGRAGLTITDQALENNGNVDMVRYSVDSTTGVATLHSDLYYFSLDGSTWQFECQSAASGRAAIDRACDMVMRTFSAR